MVSEDPREREFREARAAVPSAIRSLPKDYLEGNAAPLLLVVEELKRSLLTEWRLVQTVERLGLSEVTDELRHKVQQVAGDLEWYVQQRIFDQERTHCHNIDRIVAELMAPLRLPVAYDSEKIEELMNLLKPLRIADNDLLDELEPIAEEVRDAAQRISQHISATETDPTRIDDARAELERFTQAMASRMDRLKDLLTQMSALSNDLLTAL
jgi:DNA repair exonuclease SbcCD ATPase subunit